MGHRRRSRCPDPRDTVKATRRGIQPDKRVRVGERGSEDADMVVGMAVSCTPRSA